jgi:hypothetical protein
MTGFRVSHVSHAACGRVLAHSRVLIIVAADSHSPFKAGMPQSAIDRELLKQLAQEVEGMKWNL